MNILTEDIIHFLRRQNFVIVSTIDIKGNPHSACKGIIKINKNGKIYLLDLYKAKTYNNLKLHPNISITVVDEHHFRGYCLKGKAKAIKIDRAKSHFIKRWEKKIISRITHRVLKNIRGEKGHPKHPEALLPKPQYLIAMKIEEVIDLTPGHIKGAVNLKENSL